MKSRAERKANLMEMAEEEIEKLLEWMEATDAPDLGGIEEEVLSIRQRIGEAMTKEVIAHQESVRPVPSPDCPKCAKEMHYKGMKPKEISSMIGEVKLNRGYYYCDHCQSGLFPLDRQLDVKERNWSESIIREAAWLSGISGSYEQVEEVLIRIGKINMDDSTLWRHVQKRGEILREAEEKRKEKAMALPQIGERPRQPSPGADRMGVGIDGAMVNIRDEGWKEFKVGAVYEIAERPVRDPITGEWTNIAGAVNNSYVAHLGDAQGFGPLIWSAAQSRGWEDARDTQTIGDGAHWIWNLADEYFPLSIRTVDWYHGSEYLHDAARFLFPASASATTRWFNRAETMLFQRQARSIADAISDKVDAKPSLATDELSAAVTYFHNNHQRMQYMEFREDGFPIGSGMVESAAKQFKARFTGPGMRWSRPGLQRLIPIRAAALSHAFDDLWNSVFSSPPN